MSDAMGPLTFGKKEEQIFLGREIAQRSDYSEDTAIRIDQEVRRIVTENYERATAVLRANRARLEKMADELLAREVLDSDQVRRIVADLPIIEPVPVRPAPPLPPPSEDVRPRSRDQRPAIVPPLNKPLPQE
jgi:cell division protease FtsH